jgi:hypothetical protein
MHAHKLPSLYDIDDAAWEQLSRKKIYFGHQSVGGDILSGIKQLANEYPKIKLNILETTSPSDYDIPVFGHSLSGKNEYPISKDKTFSNVITNRLKGKLDIAFYKYCYIDFNSDADVNVFFARYKKNIETLKHDNPNVTFVHFTSPLTTVSANMMSYVRKMLGRSNRGYEENRRRNLYNRLLINEYTEKDPIFDLAKYESTAPNGQRITYSHNGEQYYAMDPTYALDHGHLNKQGQQYVAEQLLIFLAQIK